MHSVSSFAKTIAPVALVALFIVVASVSPAPAAAQTSSSSSQTAQLLPPGQNTCQMVTVTDVEPHVSGGVLESFDVTISDTSNSYVGVFAQVGNTAIPLDFITRWAGSPSGLRIHVDTPDTSVRSAVPVTLTLLSSPPGAPTCITEVSFDVSGGGVVGPYTAPSSAQNYPVSSSSSSGQSVATVANGKTAGSAGKSTEKVGSQHVVSGAQNGSSTPAVGSAVGSVVAAGSSNNMFNSICAGNNAYRLWFILLVIYIIIVAIVVFAEPWFLESSVIGSTAAILVPLILLLAFWYFSASCRAASWIPVVACIIAIIGLFLAFREYELPPLLPAPSEQ